MSRRPATRHHKVVCCWKCDETDTAETEMWVEGFEGATVTASLFFGAWVIEPGSDFGWSIEETKSL